ncbi:MAG: DNA gyrase inhibitor YacG [Paracoccaceae bacterium]|jgi:endogenous inhibitor of DNA gyrase (YacG/DUF329 family)
MSCLICKKPTTLDFRPFCSKRCADVDLGKWLTESYTIPAPLEDLSEEDEIALMAAAQTKH